MRIPHYVNECLQRLEHAGFATYLVGGCVRDSLLGLTPHDYDLCTAALPEQTEALFADHGLVLAGKKHGTVGVITPDGVIEITTFRTEGNYADNRHPEWVRFVPDIEADLARRDFTINAMAWSPIRGFADPYGGQKDLAAKTLRAVGDPETRFREDSLRILRGIRFAVRFGLAPEESTLAAMDRLSPLLDNLARERVFDELCKLLVAISAEDLLRYRHILAAAIPELRPMIGFDQRSPHHAYDLYEHTARVTGALPGDLTLRWAGLLHDTGKIPTFTQDETGRGHFYGHAKESASIADTVLLRLKAPTHLRQSVTLLIGQHMTKLEPEKKLLRRRLSKLGEATLLQLLTLQEADMGSKGTGNPEEARQFPQLRGILEGILQENACLSLKDLAVSGHDLIALGIEGPKIGHTLAYLLDQVLEERLPNEKHALLAAVNTDSAK